MLFVCENNLYAMGTALAASIHNRTSRKSKAYALTAQGTVDGMDVPGRRQSPCAAVEFVPTRPRPYFLTMPHNTVSCPFHVMTPGSIAPRAKANEWKQRDPIAAFSRPCAPPNCCTRKIKQLDASIAAEVADAVAFAEAGPWESVEELTTDVYSRNCRRSGANAVAECRR